ncbi:MAG: DUF6427 family protein [Patiriisocius sp.]|uniref:DUF6427 family protein n=1 Tax=Patiriisocius sp. TaxID=2822396 RepID=UPI003EF76F7B
MLASFFGKSSPINYVILSVIICLGYLAFVFNNDYWTFTLENVGGSMLLLTLFIFMLLLVDFIIRKNDVTGNNTFAIFIFTCFLLMVPSIFGEAKTVLASTFLLLATRRILSLKTGKNIEKKLFDAGMYITIASLFYFWSILFFVALFIAIVRLANTSFRLLFLPLISLLSVFSIVTVFYLLKDDSFSWISNWPEASSFNFKAYNKMAMLIPLTMLLSLLLWMGTSRFFQISSLKKKEKPAGFMMLIIAIVTIFVSVLSPQKNGAELLFLFFPVATFTTNYIESKKTKERFIFNEILLWVLLLLAIVVGFILK